MALEPSVQNLEDRLGDRADMLRVSIHTPVGRALAVRYDFEFTPLFIVLDGQGSEIWRGSGLPSTDTVLSQD